MKSEKINPPPAALAHTGTLKIVCSKPAAADVARMTGNHAGNSGLSSYIGMDIHPSRHSSLFLEEGSKYVTAAFWADSLQGCQNSQPSSRSLLTSKWKRFLSNPGGGQACPTPDTACHLPRCPQGCSEVTWDFPGVPSVPVSAWLHCGVGAGGTSSQPDPCCSLQGYRRSCAESSRFCLSRGKYPQIVFCLLSQRHRAAHKRDEEKDRLWVDYQPQAIFLCPIRRTTFSLHCPVRAALASLLWPPEVLVPREILTASRTCALLSVLCLPICCKISVVDSQLFRNNGFGFSLKIPSNAVLLHFPGSHNVKEFRNELRLFLLSALHLWASVNLFLPQCFFPLFIIHSFSPITAEKGPGQGGILQHVSKKDHIVYRWVHLRKVFLGSSTLKTLSPGLQNPPCRRVFNINTALIHNQPHQYFLSSCSFKRPTQSSSLGVDATSSKSQQYYLLLTNPPRICLFGFFSFLMPLMFWDIPWISLELICGLLWW